MISLGAQVKGLDRLRQQLRAISARTARERGGVEVGYAAYYGIYVHEDMTKNHPNGQAKFLEIPARVYRIDMAQIVGDTVRAGGTAKEGLRRAGEFLLEKSKELVPVDTGALRDSGFVEVVTG